MSIRGIRELHSVLFNQSQKKNMNLNLWIPNFELWLCTCYNLALSKQIKLRFNLAKKKTSAIKLIFNLTEKKSHTRLWWCPSFKQGKKWDDFFFQMSAQALKQNSNDLSRCTCFKMMPLLHYFCYMGQKLRNFQNALCLQHPSGGFSN